MKSGDVRSVHLISGMIASVLAISSAATLIRLTHAPALAIAAFRMVFAAGILWAVSPFVRTSKSSRKPWIHIVFAGFFLAMHFGLWISSLDYTSVGSSLVLVTMNPIFVAIGSTLILKEKPSLAVLLGTISSIIGCLVLVVGEASFENSTMTGNMLALGGAIAMSCYMLTGRSARSRLGLLPYITWVYTVAGVVLVVLCVGLQMPLLDLSRNTYWMMLLIAIIPQIIGHSSINWVLKYLHTSYMALVILLEPLIGSLIAFVVIGETITKWTVLGGSMIVIGVIGAFWRDIQNHWVDTRGPAL